MHTCTHAHTHLCSHKSTHSHAHTHTRTRTHAHKHAQSWMSHEWVTNESWMSNEWATNESRMSHEWVTNGSRMSHEWVTNESRMSAHTLTSVCEVCSCLVRWLYVSRMRVLHRIYHTCREWVTDRSRMSHEWVHIHSHNYSNACKLCVGAHVSPCASWSHLFSTLVCMRVTIIGMAHWKRKRFWDLSFVKLRSWKYVRETTASQLSEWHTERARGFETCRSWKYSLFH